MAGETLPTGSTNTQGLADWAAPYITNYLGKAQALSETPSQPSQWPLTAGSSNLQNKVFSGLAGLTFPSNLGQSFASPIGGGNTNNYGGPGGPAVMPQQGGFGPGVNNFGGPQVQQPPMGSMPPTPMGDYTGGGQMTQFDPNQMSLGNMPQPGQLARYDEGTSGDMLPFSGGPSDGPSMPRPGQDYGSSQGIAGLQTPQPSMQPSNIAQTYMNPYLQSVLTPQLDELRRQNEITNAATNAKMTQAGGFGGGRQAIMNAENNRNLMMEQNKTVGQGYSSAYDKAMQQFNTEQGQAKDLANMMSTQGGIERGITSEGIAADLGEFEKQRQFPYQQVQFQRDMISGLPTGSVQNTPGQLSGVGSLLSALGGGAAAAKALGYKDVSELLKGLGLSTGSSS